MRKTMRKLVAMVLAIILILPINAFAFTDIKEPITNNTTVTSNPGMNYYREVNGVREYFSSDPNKVYAKSIKPEGTKVSTADTANTAAVAIPKTDNVRKGQLKSTVNIEKNKIKKETTDKYDKLAKNKTKNKSKVKSDELIVKFKNNANKNEINSLYQKNSLKTKEKLGLINAEVITLPKGVKAEDMMKKLKADKNIEYVQPNYIYYPDNTNDPYFNQLWGLENVGQPILGSYGTPDVDIDINDAWNNYGGGSNQVVVGVIDTGIDIKHPDIMNNIWVNKLEAMGAPGVDDDNNGYIDDINGWDFYNNDNSVFDAIEGDEHGTHVAGTIAASANNNIGVVGIAHNVKIMPLKFLGPQGGYTSDAIIALEYAKKMGVKITNNSWGGGDFDSALKDAIENSGTLFIAAAGNDYWVDTDIIPHYPSSYDSVNLLSVAAIENTGELAYFSNYGVNSVDVAAPGAKILSSVPRKYPYAAALQNDTGTFKTMFDGFGLEQLASDTERQAMMAKALEFFGVTPDSKILLVQDDFSDNGYLNVSTAYLNTLQALGYQPTLTEVSYLGSGPDAATMSQYDLVIWFTGEVAGNSYGTNINNTDQVELISYLENGGKLYISGRDAGWNIENTEFYNYYLDAWFVNEDNGRKQVIGYADSAFAGETYNLDKFNYYVDYLLPFNGSALPALHFDEELTYDNAYAYYNGTSMATPHVTGIAALLLSNGTTDPILMKRKIMMGVQPQANLEGMVFTGGVVNAANSLKLNIELDDDIPGIELKEINTGTMHMDTDLDDVYYVDAEYGDVINIALNGDAGTDFDLHIYSPESTTVKNTVGLLASSENIGSSESIKYQVQNSGRYYVDVYAYAGAGSYTLTFDKNIELEDSDLYYTYGWTQLSNANQYTNGTAMTTNSAGSFADVYFTGSSIKLTAFKNANMGIARVFVDGKAIGDVNLYSISPQYKQVVFEKSIQYGYHHLEIKWTGLFAKGARKTSTGINIDMVSIGTAKTPPSAPTELALYSYMEAISVEFRTNQTENVDYYKIYRSEDNINFTDIAWLSNDGYNYIGFWDDNNGNGLEDKVYYYKVTAVNVYGLESNSSPVLSARPTMPNSVYMLEDTSNHVEYYGIWNIDNNPALSGGTRHYTMLALSKVTIPFSGYSTKIIIKGPTNATVKVTWPDGYSDTFDIYIPDGDYDQEYWISQTWGGRATGKQWVLELIGGSLSFDVNIVKDLDYEAPAAPATLSSAINGNQVDLSWEDNLEADVASYNINRSEVEGQIGTHIAATVDNSYADDSIQLGKTYYYTITAVDYAGNESAISNVATVVTQLPVPGVPTGLTVIDDAGKAKLNWNANTEAFVTGYNVYRSDVSGVEGSIIGTTASGVTTYTDANVTPGSTYYYAITAVNQTVESARSTETAYTVPLAAPAAPTGLAAVNNGTGIDISWSAVSNATGYNVYRSTTAGVAGTLLTTANPITVPTYTDSAVTHGTTYYYTVTAVGGNGYESVKSAEASVKYMRPLNQAKIYEENYTDLIYSGTWTTHTNASHSGGTMKYSLTKGAYVEFTFIGSGIKWISNASTARGYAIITIDGYETLVDNYAPTMQYKKIVYDNMTLNYGVHTIRIEVAGTKNTIGATSTAISIDAFEIIQ